MAEAGLVDSAQAVLEDRHMDSHSRSLLVLYLEGWMLSCSFPSLFWLYIIFAMPDTEGFGGCVIEFGLDICSAQGIL
jgi:hypothetical protein